MYIHISVALEGYGYLAVQRSEALKDKPSIDLNS